MTTSLAAKPRLPVNLGGFTTALKIVGVELRYNVRSQMIEFRRAAAIGRPRTG